MNLYVDEDVLFKLPEDVSDRAAVTVEPLAVIIRAVHQIKFQALESAGLLEQVLLAYSQVSY